MVKMHASGLKRGQVLGAKANKSRSEVANAKARGVTKPAGKKPARTSRKVVAPSSKMSRGR